jgi:hypothetical protein
MDLSRREVAGLPKVGGHDRESPRESPTPHIARGGGASPCAFALLASLFGPMVSLVISERR